MGQKVNPNGMRLGIIRDWNTQWYANKKEVADLLLEDIEIRKYIDKHFPVRAQVSRIVIRRVKQRVFIEVYTARPGMVIGKDGLTKKEIVEYLQKMTGKSVYLNIVQIKNPNLDPLLVARRMAEDLENRMSFRRVQKKAIRDAMRAGAKGIKTEVSGRLGGAEMARSEHYSEGTVPLHTLRSDIEYAHAEANTTYGKLGVKVWICKGEILPDKKGVK